MCAKVLSIVLIFLYIANIFTITIADDSFNDDNFQQSYRYIICMEDNPKKSSRLWVDSTYLSIKNSYNIINKSYLTVTSEESIHDLKNLLNEDENFVFVEPDYKININAIPNDIKWPLQWAPSSINCESAWDIQKGDESVTISIIDTGIDYSHPDLNHYLMGGYDWVNQDEDPMDDNGHGTHCAGIAAATINNSIGIAGVSNVSFIAEKILDAEGSGYVSDAISAVLNSVDLGADVISMSFSIDSYSSAFEDACDYAWENGIILVASAGNDGTNTVNYPARFENVLSVGATDINENLCSFSNYGLDLDVVAPGEDILSTYFGGGYEELDGTSMACPHVSGLAAIILSEFHDISNDRVSYRIKHFCKDLGTPGFDENYGWGLIDVNRSLTKFPLNASFNYFPDEWEDSHLIRFLDRSVDQEWQIVNWTWDFGDGNLSYERNPKHYFSDEKNYSVTLNVKNQIGENDIFVKNVSIPCFSDLITVNKSMSDDPQNHTWDSIQEGIDDANEGDIVFVHNGEYNEEININKTVRMITLENKSARVLGGFCLQSDYTSIENFEIENGYEYLNTESGIDGYCKSGILLHSSNNNIENNLIKNIVGGNSEDTIGGIGSGLYLSDSNNNEITLNSFYNISGGKGGCETVMGTVIAYYGQLGGTGSAIYLQNSNDNLLNYNVAEKIIGGTGGNRPGTYLGSDGDGGYSSGIMLSNSENNLVDNNIFENLISGKGGKIEGGGLTSNDGKTSAIFSINSSNNSILNNEILDIDPSESNTVTNILSGIYLKESHYNTINGNQIDDIEAKQTVFQGVFYPAGIFLDQSSNNSLNENSISNIMGSNAGNLDIPDEPGKDGEDSIGIYLENSNNNFLTNNSIDTIVGGLGGEGFNGMDHYLEGTNGGNGGNANGIKSVTSHSNFYDGNDIKNIIGGDGGLGKWGYSPTVNGGKGGEGGQGIGLNLLESESNEIKYNDFERIIGGNGGDSGEWGIDTIGGKGGKAFGMLISNSQMNFVNDSQITEINGGKGGKGGSAVNYGYIEYPGGMGGKSVGIYITFSNATYIINSKIHNINGGRGGKGGDYDEGANGGDGGNCDGIYLDNSINSMISNNLIMNIIGGEGGEGGEPVGTGPDGYSGDGGDAHCVNLQNSDLNIIESNEITSSTGGETSDDDSVSEKGLGYGFYLDDSNKNEIFNNFISNEINAKDFGNNFWNTTKMVGLNVVNGKYLAGNYWSDYNGEDTNDDCIGDTDLPHTSDENIYHGGDLLPLVMDTSPPSIHSVSILPHLRDGFGFVNISCKVLDNSFINNVRLTLSPPNIETLYYEMKKYDADNETYYLNQSYDYNGTYRFQIRARDKSGHSVYSEKYYFWLSNYMNTTFISSNKTIFDGKMDLGITINLSEPVNLTIGRFAQNPYLDVNHHISLLNFLHVDTDNLSHVLWPMNITVFYNISELSGILERQLIGLYYWNEKVENWCLFNKTGVNQSYEFDGYNGYLWTDTDHLTFIAIGADVENPSKVTGLSVSNLKDGKLKLKWDEAEDNLAVDYYCIYRDGSLIFTTSQNAYTDTGLENGQSYKYRISAVDSVGNEGELSALASGSPTASSSDGGPPPPPSGGGGGFIPPAPTGTNSPPVANISVNVETGFVGETILFDGSGSFDAEGNITSWLWDFGDGTFVDESVVSHSFSTTGLFEVSLTVADEENETDTCHVLISVEQANRAPEITEFSGPDEGSVDVSYEFTLSGSDADNDSIHFVVNWDDNSEPEITEEIEQNESITLNHSWNSPGFYTIKVYAEDEENATSSTVEKEIQIDVKYCSDVGYFIDDDADGVYDRLFCNETQKITDVGYEDDFYKLDTDGNGEWNYYYVEGQGLSTIGLKEADDTPGFSMVFLLLIIGLFVFLGYRKRES